jgi:hypothetical protein
LFHFHTHPTIPAHTINNTNKQQLQKKFFIIFSRRRVGRRLVNDSNNESKSTAL